jgi:hypothetical protein
MQNRVTAGWQIKDAPITLTILITDKTKRSAPIADMPPCDGSLLTPSWFYPSSGKDVDFFWPEF